MKIDEWKKIADRGYCGEMILDDWDSDRKELLECARRLEIFASTYRTHHLRNPEDKLDEVLAIYERLK